MTCPTWQQWNKQRRVLGLVFLLGLAAVYYADVKDVTEDPAVAATVALKTTSVSQVSNLSELFEVHFPQCAMPKQIPAKQSLADDWISWLNASEDRIRYTATNRPPRYDHLSCAVMKARYNCAAPPGSSLATAADYQMIWRNSDTDETCHLNQLVEFIGGPAGLYAQRRNKHPIQILLQGNSYLRQVWEAFVCGFHHQITNLTLLQGGPMLSLAYIQSRSGKLITKEELGHFLPNQQTGVAQQGCHGTGHAPISDFYWNTAHADYAKRFPSATGNVAVPPNIAKCKDDMAMVEFGGNVQFFFLFHPSRYNDQALVEAYRRLGISSTATMEFQVDTMIWMDEAEALGRHLTAARILSLEGLLPLLVQAQNTSLGQYFGANNPWITHPPDNHPCMPGIPDDEANVLMLFLLWQELLEQQGPG